ncbi:MAG: hypothetical protein KDH86_14815 [Anaerolineae bacterium]|nr:hypothetical protein [Anaerolineae bacterium]
MNTQLTEPTTTESVAKQTDTRGRIIAGVALILIGALLMIAQITQSANLALLVPIALGVIFLAWGLITRTFGLIVPGSILAGIGLGTYLITGPYSTMESNPQGGVFMLAFAGGWLLMCLLSPLTRSGFQWWPLIPGGIIGAVGLALVGGSFGMQVLQIIGYGWPLILVAVGIYLLIKRRG